MTDRRESPRIAVAGGHDCTADEASQAEQVGRRLAAAGAVLYCGGLSGIMEAACRGARAAGGLTVGILPGTEAASANSSVDIPVVTGMGDARNVILVSSVEAVIAIGGRFGTLSEIALALKRGTPVIGLGTWGLEPGRLDGAPFTMAASPQEAVTQALALGRAGIGRRR